MKLKAFRVQMYRNIIDSTWVDIGDLTVVVGKNQSGKTSILKALQKLNPSGKLPFELNKEWPRGKRKDRNPSQVAVQARFTFTDSERQDLKQLTGHDVNCEHIEIARTYGGELSVSIPNYEFPIAKSIKELEDLLEIYEFETPIGEAFIQKAKELWSQVVEIARKGTLDSDSASEVIETHTDELLRLTSEETSEEYANEKGYLEFFPQQIKALVEVLSRPKPKQIAEDFARNNLPTFIYMDEYRIFRGAARLNKVKERFEEGEETEEDKTFLTILELAGLDLDFECARVGADDIDQRRHDYRDASKKLTDIVASNWKQDPFEIEFDADGNDFFTWIKKGENDGLIGLDEQSQGFKWFFSFDLNFLRESNREFRNCVLLLDEPGLHLHPDGQKDLLERLEAYATENTLIYSAHLPFMIDLRQPERIRVMQETSDGMIVTANLHDAKPEEKFTLQAALEPARQEIVKV